MKKTSRQTRKRPLVSWQHARPNRYAAYLADRPWWVQLDPDLTDLLSGSGTAAAHLLGFAERKRSRRERRVVVIPMTDHEHSSLRPMLDRIGAKVEHMPPHPNLLRAGLIAKPRRRAG